MFSKYGRIFKYVGQCFIFVASYKKCMPNGKHFVVKNYHFVQKISKPNFSDLLAFVNPKISVQSQLQKSFLAFSSKISGKTYAFLRNSGTKTRFLECRSRCDNLTKIMSLFADSFCCFFEENAEARENEKLPFPRIQNRQIICFRNES